MPTTFIVRRRRLVVSPTDIGRFFAPAVWKRREYAAMVARELAAIDALTPEQRRKFGVEGSEDPGAFDLVEDNATAQ